MNLYRWIMTTAGLVALVTAVVFLSILIAATADGPGGIEVAMHWSAVAVVVAINGAVIHISLWAFRRALREEVPTIAQITADRLAERLAPALEAGMKRTAADTIGRTSALVRESVTGELMQEMLDAAVKRARTYGMTHQVRARAAAARRSAPAPVAQLVRRDGR